MGTEGFALPGRGVVMRGAIFCFFMLASLFLPKLARAEIHVGLGLGAAFEPAVFTFETQNTKSYFGYFASSGDISTLYTFKLWRPFYTAVGGHAAYGPNMKTIGLAVSSGVRFDVTIFRFSITYLFLAGHTGAMEGQALLETSVGW